MNWLTIPATPPPDPGVIEFGPETWADHQQVIEVREYLDAGKHHDRRQFRGRHD